MFNAICKECKQPFMMLKSNQAICSPLCVRVRAYKRNRYKSKIRPRKGYNPKTLDNLKADNNMPYSSQTLQKNNKTGYIGVCYNKSKKLYVGTIKHHNKTIWYKTSEDLEYLVDLRDEYIIDNLLPHKLNRV